MRRVDVILENWDKLKSDRTRGMKSETGKR